MFGSKTFGRLLLAILVLLVGWLIVHQSEAKGAIKPCKLGELCIETGFASSKPLASGSIVTFNVKITNRLGKSAKGVVVRYTTPRPTHILGIKPTPSKGGPDVTVWRIGKLLPGAVWHGKVKVEILTYASKKVHNEARVSGENIFTSKVLLPYELNMAPIIASN